MPQDPLKVEPGQVFLSGSLIVCLSARAADSDVQCACARGLPRSRKVTSLGGMPCSYRIIGFSIHITSQYLPNFRPTSVKTPIFLNPNLS